MYTVVYLNQKGGVGKTTTVVHTARAAHRRGLRTLVIDMDPQGNTTLPLLGSVPEGIASVADVLVRRYSAEQVIAPTGWDKVDVMPSGGDTLADVAGELIGVSSGREYRLREALVPLASEYDLCLIDCPPSLDQLPINALVAASRVVIVTTAELFSSTGIARLLRTIAAVRHYNSREDLEVAGITVNSYEARTTRHRHWFGQLVNDPAAVEEQRWSAPLTSAVVPMRPGDPDSPPTPVWTPPIRKATWIAGAIEAGFGLDEMGDVAAVTVAGHYDGYLTRLLERAP